MQLFQPIVVITILFTRLIASAKTNYMEIDISCDLEGEKWQIKTSYVELSIPDDRIHSDQDPQCFKRENTNCVHVVQRGLTISGKPTPDFLCNVYAYFRPDCSSAWIVINEFWEISDRQKVWHSFQYWCYQMDESD